MSSGNLARIDLTREFSYWGEGLPRFAPIDALGNVLGLLYAKTVFEELPSSFLHLLTRLDAAPPRAGGVASLS